MANNPTILKARIQQPDITDHSIVAKDPVLLDGECFFVLNDEGLIVGAIRGDGVRKLSQIPVNYFGTGTGEGWEPTLDNEPLSGSVNYVNSGKLYLWGQKFVLAQAGKVLSDNNFTDALQEKLESLSPTPATSWAALTGDPMDNTAFATIINDLTASITTKQTAAQVLTTVMQYAYPLGTSGSEIWYDRDRIYGTRSVPVAANITDSITNPLYVPKVYASGIIYLDVGATARTLPSRFVKIEGDMVLNNVNIINYLYVSSSRVEYSIYPAI